MTGTADLAAWLTAVWDEEERRLTHPTFCGPVWPTTAQLLARIAADRKILEEHGAYEHEEYGTTCWTCMPGGQHYPCRTLRLLASPYADSEGFRSEWLVERQGVEG